MLVEWWDLLTSIGCCMFRRKLTLSIQIITVTNCATCRNAGSGILRSHVVFLLFLYLHIDRDVFWTWLLFTCKVYDSAVYTWFWKSCSIHVLTVYLPGLCSIKKSKVYMGVSSSTRIRNAQASIGRHGENFQLSSPNYSEGESARREGGWQRINRNMVVKNLSVIQLIIFYWVPLVSFGRLPQLCSFSWCFFKIEKKF